MGGDYWEKREERQKEIRECTLFCFSSCLMYGCISCVDYSMFVFL